MNEAIIEVIPQYDADGKFHEYVVRGRLGEDQLEMTIGSEVTAIAPTALGEAVNALTKELIE